MLNTRYQAHGGSCQLDSQIHATTPEDLLGQQLWCLMGRFVLCSRRPPIWSRWRIVSFRGGGEGAALLPLEVNAMANNNASGILKDDRSNMGLSAIANVDFGTNSHTKQHHAGWYKVCTPRCLCLKHSGGGSGGNSIQKQRPCAATNEGML